MQHKQNFVQGTTTNEPISLFSLWMDTLVRQQSTSKLLMIRPYNKKLFESTTTLARTVSPWGTESGVLNR